MGALTAGLVAADIWFRHSDRVFKHAIFGSLATLMFYMLCARGYEAVNWVLIALLPIYAVLTLVFLFLSGDNSYRGNKDEECEADVSYEYARKPCGCQVERPCNCKPKVCPVKPMKLETKCGISRYT